MNRELDFDHKTPAELLPVFYAENNLDMDGGNSSPTVKMDIVKGIHFYIPNFDARRKAVLWHDIHHMVTGYSASHFLGECEISASEIASGCKSYWAAFLINTQGVLLGCYINPRKIIQAYARGRRTKNLYHDLYTQDEILKTPVMDIKKRLLLDRYPKETKAGIADIISLLLFLLFASVYSILMMVTIPFLIVFNIWIFSTRSRLATDPPKSR